MGRVVIAHVNDATAGSFPVLDGVVAEGAIETRGVIAQATRPLCLWVHDMAPGAVVQWDCPREGHVAYVWSGNAIANGVPLKAEATVVVEHGARATLRAGDSGARVAHFHRSLAMPEPLQKTGGHVHIVGPDGLFKSVVPETGTAQILWADSNCPTCDLWLHQSRLPIPRPQGGAHYHTADEIIFILDGGMLVGNRVLVPGTALAVDAGTIYSFGMGAEGLTFINFRSQESLYVRTRGGKPAYDPVNERDNIRSSGALMRERGIDVWN